MKCLFSIRLWHRLAISTQTVTVTVNYTEYIQKYVGLNNIKTAKFMSKPKAKLTNSFYGPYITKSE